METTHKLILLVGILCTMALPMNVKLTPENSAITVDIDEVSIEKAWWHKIRLVVGGMLQDVKNATTYINALKNVSKEYKRDANGHKEALCDEDGNQITGLTFQFLYHGMRNPQLAPYAAWIVKTMENSRQIIPGTVTILTYLKEHKGYTINFATNKDRVSFDLTAQAFGNRFSSIPTKVFVAHPGNSDAVLARIKAFADLTSTPASYKELAYTALEIQSTDAIFHAPGIKPDKAYFQYVEKIVGTDKHQIFIDDKKANVEGFNTLQNSSSALRHGIHFKDPVQLANEFITLGILSETEDHALLQEIRYPGITGAIKLATKKLIAQFTPATA